jgi:photosystem II stability/assembly factor-like uncharacterized protein
MVLGRTLLAAVGSLLLAAGPAAAETLTVHLKTAGAGAPVPGAAAAAVASSACAPAGGDRCEGAVGLDGAGEGTITGLVGGATYTVTANVPGFGVARRIGLAAGTTANVEIAPSLSPFASAALFGGAPAGFYADGQPGVFYALTDQVPQLYRTTDWGGRWLPVSGAGDDGDRGLPASAPIADPGAVATSGWPGELAVALNGAVFFSRDYGITWALVGGAAAPGARLAWGHAGATSVLVATAGDHQLVADMTGDAPAFAAMSTDYARAADGRALAVGNGSDRPYVAVADSTGAVAVYALDASGTPGAAVMTAAGFPAGAPLAVALGGAAGATGPPTGLAVASATQVGMAVRATADPAWGAASVKDAGCATGHGGSFTADTGTAAGDGRGALGRCWLALAAAALTATPTATPGFAIDAGWGQTFGGTTSRVTLRGLPRGPLKGTSIDMNGLPGYDPATTAAAGPAAGGLSVAGFTAARVAAAAFGPVATQLAAIAEPGSGAAGFASADGGATQTLAAGTGGFAVDWFAGTSDSWLVFGAPAASSHVLTAFRGWTAATPAEPAPNLDGAQAGDDSLLLSGSGLDPAQVVATALAGASGSDVLFAGLSASAGGAVRRMRLTMGAADPLASEVARIGDGQITNAVHALAYCPGTDVLLAGTGGGLWRVTGAAGGAPAATQVASVPSEAVVLDVAAHCASGRVWAGTDSGLLGSTDGGQTFAVVPHGRPGPVRAIGVGAAAAEALIAVGDAGAIERTLDGGATWKLVSDPVVRSFAAPGVTSLLLGPPAGLGALSSRDTLIAGAGLVAAALRTSAAGAGTGTPGKDRTRPVIKGFAVTPKSFRRGRGTTFRFRVSEPVRVRIALTLVTVGYKKGKRCVAERPRVPRKPVYCQREVAAGVLRRKGLKAGRAKVPFTGRIGKRRLPVGSYRALLTAVDEAGNRSVVKTQHLHVTAE